MQRGEEFLECIVTFMSVYHGPLPGRSAVTIEFQRMQWAVVTRVYDLEPPTPRVTYAWTGTGVVNGARRRMAAHLLGPDDTFIHYARSQPKTTLRQGVVIGETGSLKVLDRAFH